ncbi:GNAT family N-acetyltransferase [Haloglomus salinum]|uniref:GNAT family N-acetyltransferase n=1 Tax=Haloglomus salinum TaxID=2962673 RepID=UPI0020C9815D|nr:GNAT family N-acetyltransferase [Haloglomus salinum]
MQFSDDLEFDHRDRKDIYDYIERNGRVDYDEARAALNMDETAFGHHVAILRREGVIERDEAEDELRLAFEDAEVEIHSVGDVEFTIRQAHEDDLDGLVEAIRTALADRTYIVGETVADTVDHEDVLLRHNEVQSRVFFVATVEGAVVGWVNLDHPEVDSLEHTAELTVGVVPEYRGHTIGSELMERAYGWARDNGYEKLYNSVPATNERGMEWLEDHGWETEAVRERHYRIGDEYVDEVMMAVWP